MCVCVSVGMCVFMDTCMPERRPEDSFSIQPQENILSPFLLFVHISIYPSVCLFVIGDRVSS